MILPTKHIKPEMSLIAGGAVVLSHLSASLTVSALWEEVRQEDVFSSFERFILALDLLFIVGAVDHSDGQLRRLRA